MMGEVPSTVLLSYGGDLMTLLTVFVTLYAHLSTIAFCPLETLQSSKLLCFEERMTAFNLRI